MSMSLLKNGVMGGITMTQPVFAGGQIINGNRLAAVGVEMSKVQREQSENAVCRTVEQYFWQVVGHYDQLQKGGLYIHSNAEPLGDFDPAYAPFIENIEKRGIELITLRCSGHADVAELKEIIAGFEPKILAPVHTLHPELEENPFGERILPKRGEVFTLS